MEKHSQAGRGAVKYATNNIFLDREGDWHLQEDDVNKQGFTDSTESILAGISNDQDMDPNKGDMWWYVPRHVEKNQILPATSSIAIFVHSPIKRTGFQAPLEREETSRSAHDVRKTKIMSSMWAFE